MSDFAFDGDSPIFLFDNGGTSIASLEVVENDVTSVLFKVAIFVHGICIIGGVEVEQHADMTVMFELSEAEALLANLTTTIADYRKLVPTS